MFSICVFLVAFLSTNLLLQTKVCILISWDKDERLKVFASILFLECPVTAKSTYKSLNLLACRVEVKSFSCVEISVVGLSTLVDDTSDNQVSF